MSILPFFITLLASVHSFHRDYGPILGAFNPTNEELPMECTGTNKHACLVSAKKICREKMAKPFNPFLPIPWWYFYCRWVMTMPPKSTTLHPYYRKTLDEVLKFKKSLKKNNMMSILPFFITLLASVHSYHRDYGPIFGAFNPTNVELATECTETNKHACLVIPTKKICREKLAKPLNPFLPIPWWYFYCQWVITMPPKSTTKSTTLHPYYRKTLDEVLKFKKSLKKNNMFIN